MMIRIRKAAVTGIIEKDEKTAIVNVEYDGLIEKAVNYNLLSGDISVGDIVYINTDATYLNLGTGGYSFVMINETRGASIDLDYAGEIMKLRYTPYQVNCMYPDYDKCTNLAGAFEGLGGMAVICGELHSMLAPAACLLKYLMHDIKIVYIMTDGGCLPIDLSFTVKSLKSRGILSNTITSGNSFGGDYEAVNIYDALVIAYSVLKCDIAIITMGPGIQGTGTRYGFSGIEQGYIIDCVNTLKGAPVFIPRISFRDLRPRHYGISHHTLTILEQVAKTRAHVVFPVLGGSKLMQIKNMIKSSSINASHYVYFLYGDDVLDAVKYFDICPSTMGRGIEDEREFFLTCGSAARFAADVLKGIVPQPYSD